MKTKLVLALLALLSSLALAATPTAHAAEPKDSLDPVLLALKKQGPAVKGAAAIITSFLAQVATRWGTVAAVKWTRVPHLERRRLERLDRLLQRIHARVGKQLDAVPFTLLRKLRWLVRRGETIAAAYR